MKSSKISVLLFLFVFLSIFSACDGSGHKNNTGGSDNPNTNTPPPADGTPTDEENGGNNGGNGAGLLPMSQRAPEINLEAGLRIPGIPTKSDLDRTLRPPVSGGNPLDIPARPSSGGIPSIGTPTQVQPNTPTLPGSIRNPNPVPGTGIPDADGIPVATLTRPSQVGNFNAVAITADSIRVSWADQSLETEYRIFYRILDLQNTDSGTTVNLPTNTTTHVVSGLHPDTEYLVSIAAYNSAGQGSGQGKIVRTQARPVSQVQAGSTGTSSQNLQPWGQIQIESEASTDFSASLFQNASFLLGASTPNTLLIAYYDANQNGIIDEARSAGFASGVYPYFYSSAQNDRIVSRGYRYEAGANLVLEAQFLDQGIPMFVIVHLNYNAQAGTLTAVRMFAGQNLLGANITGENNIVAISSTDGVQNGTGEILLPSANQGGFLSLNSIRAYVMKPYSIDLGGTLAMYTFHNIVNMSVTEVPLEAE